MVKRGIRNFDLKKPKKTISCFNRRFAQAFLWLENSSKVSDVAHGPLVTEVSVNIKMEIGHASHEGNP